MEEYVPEVFDADKVDDILNDLKHTIWEKLFRKIPDVKIRFKNIRFNPHEAACDVEVFNNGNQLKYSGEFEFDAYPEYWDESDYRQHIKTTITKFVNELVH